MATQQMGVPTYYASEVRAKPIQRYIRHLFNRELVDWQFEDFSIDPIKIYGYPLGIGNFLYNPGNLGLYSRYANAAGIGAKSFVAGNAARADEKYSVAIGYKADIPFGQEAVSIGYNSQVAANFGIAIGSQATVPYGGSYNAVSIGHYAYTLGAYSVALGYGARTGFSHTIAIGTVAYAGSGMAIGSQSVSYSPSVGQAIGWNALSYGNYGMSIGYGAYNDATKAMAIGYSADAGGVQSVALGTNSNASAQNSIALGPGANASAIGATSIGLNVQNSTPSSIAMGWGYAAGDYMNMADFTPAASVKAITHQIPVVLNGSTYYMLLST